jgi:hypothetical protein
MDVGQPGPAATIGVVSPPAAATIDTSATRAMRASDMSTWSNIGQWNPVRRPVLTLWALATVACADARGPTCLPLVEGVEVVDNLGPGLWSGQGRTPVLVELWRAGGLAEGEDLGLPIAIAAGPGGGIAIPDFQLAEVTGVAGDGRWLGTLTRNGAGPGEVRQPVAAAWTEEGQLVAFDIVGSKVVFLGEDALPAREDLAVPTAVTGPIVASGGFRGAAVTPDGTVFVLPMAEGPADERGPQTTATTSVLLARDGMAAVDTILEVTAPVVTTERGNTVVARGHPEALAAAGPDGVIAVGSPDGTYRVLLYSPGGTALRQVCRAAPPFPLDVREEGRAAAEPDPALMAALAAGPAPDALAAYGRLVVGRGGALWVQRERASPFGGGDAGIESIHGVAGATHDVFDGDGRYLGSVRAPDGAYIQAVSSDTVWAFEFGSLDEASVVAYGLAWN